MLTKKQNLKSVLNAYFEKIKFLKVECVRHSLKSTGVKMVGVSHWFSRFTCKVVGFIMASSYVCAIILCCPLFLSPTTLRYAPKKQRFVLFLSQLTFPSALINWSPISFKISFFPLMILFVVLWPTHTHIDIKVHWYTCVCMYVCSFNSWCCVREKISNLCLSVSRYFP